MISLRHQVTDVRDTQRSKLPVIFTCKVAYQKSQSSVYICKSYCEKL